MKRLIFLLLIEACFIYVISVRGQSVQTDGSYEAAVASLAEANDAQLVQKAIAALESAGTKAFPTLLAHLNDKAKASEAFQRAEGSLDAVGNFVLHEPTIGEACFYLIQAQVEGNWPKAYRQYYFLSSENIVSWWQSRKEKSLTELRVEAARASLTKARQGRGTPNYYPGAVRFLEKHLREARAGRNDW
jgi:hypothetical protein